MERAHTAHDDRAVKGTRLWRRLLPRKRRKQPRLSLYEPQSDDVAATVVTALILLLILGLAAVL